MDKRARECGAPLCRKASRRAGELILEMRDSAELEHFNGSLAGGGGIYAADAKQRHRDILRHGEGWQQARVVKKKAECLIAKRRRSSSARCSDALSIQRDLSGIGGLKQTENAQQESSAAEHPGHQTRKPFPNRTKP